MPYMHEILHRAHVESCSRRKKPQSLMAVKGATYLQIPNLFPFFLFLSLFFFPTCWRKPRDPLDAKIR